MNKNLQDRLDGEVEAAANAVLASLASELRRAAAMAEADPAGARAVVARAVAAVGYEPAVNVRDNGNCALAELDAVVGAVANAFDQSEKRDGGGKWTAGGSLKADAAKQAAWLAGKAKEHGYAGVGDLLEKDPGLFQKLGHDYRKPLLVPVKRVGDGKDAKLVHAETGEDAPDHIKGLKLPPAWTDVHANPDPRGDLLAQGKDAKGRVQSVYSEAHTARQAAAKFSRIHELMEKRDYIFKQNEANMHSDDFQTREDAACMKLVQQTGVRPGSDTDTGAEKQAYGATTLLGKHVKVGADGSVRLQFVGKKGVDLDIPVDDPATAALLRDRKEVAGDKGKLFQTDDAKLRDYSHTLDGGGFKPKDFRTLKGTSTAAEEVAKNPERCATLKEYKKRVGDIAKKVAAKLGNTPAIALQSYISPAVFKEIQPA